MLKSKQKSLVTLSCMKFITLTQRAQISYHQIVQKNLHIFALSMDFLILNNFCKQKLKLMDDNSVYITNYRIPQAHKVEIDNSAFCFQL